MYEVIIITPNHTNEFVCRTFQEGVLQNSVLFQDVVEPVTGKTYNKVVSFQPGWSFNFRKVDEE